MSTTMTMLASEHTIRLPSADQVPVGVDRHEIPYTSGRSRRSVPSVSATHRRSPGPPICGPGWVRGGRRARDPPRLARARRTALQAKVLATLRLGEPPGQFTPGDPDQVVEIHGPDADRPVGARRGELRAVRAERQGGHLPLVAFQDEELVP